MSDVCALCGKPAEGLATINDERYCHDEESPSCYEKASRVRSLRQGPEGLFIAAEVPAVLIVRALGEDYEIATLSIGRGSDLPGLLRSVADEIEGEA